MQIDKNSSSEIIYFPVNKKKPASVQDQSEQLQLKIYRQMVDFLCKDPEIKISIDDGKFEITKDAIAFFIEATKQLNPEDWQEKISDVIVEIQKLRSTKKDSKEAHKETTWLLDNAISNLYQTSIAMKIAAHEKDIQEVEFYTMLFDDWESARHLRKTRASRGCKVSVGGVNRDLLPEWYKKNFIKSSFVT